MLFLINRVDRLIVPPISGKVVEKYRAILFLRPKAKQDAIEKQYYSADNSFLTLL